MTDVEQIVGEEIFDDYQQDPFGLWVIIAGLEDHGEADRTARRKKTLSIVRSLLEAGYVEAGLPTQDGTGFQRWERAPAETLKRITSEWDALGREPTIGDIVWFRLTDKGRQHAATLVGQGRS